MMLWRYRNLWVHAIENTATWAPAGKYLPSLIITDEGLWSLVSHISHMGEDDYQDGQERGLEIELNHVEPRTVDTYTLFGWRNCGLQPGLNLVKLVNSMRRSIDKCKARPLINRVTYNKFM